ncbi:MAG: two component transcriptional regulator, AraC family, partial [Bacillus sp. (in: firmicutes)]|nr:two component transcriptional regulator, AraC family [Bacillus sp. (in: firmicutes)]
TSEFKNYEISEKLGYSSSDYFCRLFKGYTGHTPIEFRKMNI